MKKRITRKQVLKAKASVDRNNAKPPENLVIIRKELQTLSNAFNEMALELYAMRALFTSTFHDACCPQTKVMSDDIVRRQVSKDYAEAQARDFTVGRKRR